MIKNDTNEEDYEIIFFENISLYSQKWLVQYYWKTDQ